LFLPEEDVAETLLRQFHSDVVMTQDQMAEMVDSPLSFPFNGIIKYGIVFCFPVPKTGERFEISPSVHLSEI
jgi:hypothetical protein